MLVVVVFFFFVSHNIINKRKQFITLNDGHAWLMSLQMIEVFVRLSVCRAYPHFMNININDYNTTITAETYKSEIILIKMYINQRHTNK